MFADRDFRKLFVDGGQIEIQLDRRKADTKVVVRRPAYRYFDEEDHFTPIELTEAEAELLHEQLGWLLGR